MTTAADPGAVNQLAHDAGHIAALATLLGIHLQGDPSTSLAGEAVQGIGAMARQLSETLLDLAEPEN